jgi:short-subunit dehydrogenase
VLCPGAIETPLLEQRNPPGSPVPWVPDTRRFLTTLGGPPYPVEKCAEETLAAVARNERVIVLPARARFGWRLGRLFPALIEKLCAPAVQEERRSRGPAPASPAAALSTADDIPTREAANS